MDSNSGLETVAKIIDWENICVYNSYSHLKVFLNFAKKINTNKTSEQNEYYLV